MENGGKSTLPPLSITLWQLFCRSLDLNRRSVVKHKDNSPIPVNNGFLHHHRPDGIVPVGEDFQLLFEGANEQGHGLVLLAAKNPLLLQPLQIPRYVFVLFGQRLVSFEVHLLTKGRMYVHFV